MDEPIDGIQATESTLRTLSVHEHAPVFSMYVQLFLSVTFLGEKERTNIYFLLL